MPESCRYPEFYKPEAREVAATELDLFQASVNFSHLFDNLMLQQMAAAEITMCDKTIPLETPLYGIPGPLSGETEQTTDRCEEAPLEDMINCAVGLIFEQHLGSEATDEERVAQWPSRCRVQLDKRLQTEEQLYLLRLELVVELTEAPSLTHEFPSTDEPPETHGARLLHAIFGQPPIASLYPKSQTFGRFLGLQRIEDGLERECLWYHCEGGDPNPFEAPVPFRMLRFDYGDEQHPNLDYAGIIREPFDAILNGCKISFVGDLEEMWGLKDFLYTTSTNWDSGHGQNHIWDY